MPFNTACPHCNGLCLIHEQYIGKAVTCGRCQQMFTVRAPAPAIPASTPSGQPLASLAEKAKGVLRSLVPFSKVDPYQIPPQHSGGAAAPPNPAGSSPPSAQPAGAFPAARPVTSEEDEDDSVEIDFGPGVASALQQRAAPPPPPTPIVSPGQTWSAPKATGVCRLDIAGATSPGMVRSRNEDSYLIQYINWANLDRRHELALLVVADGMGGHEAGDRASHMAIQTIAFSLSSFFNGLVTSQISEPTPAQISQTINQAIRTANQTVHRAAQADNKLRGMGTTAAIVVVYNGQMVIGHVGDCRVYVYRAGKVTQLTRDQTLVEKMVQAGKLRPEEAANHPARNEVAQAIGRQATIEPALLQSKLAVGDWLIVACDGLHAHVNASKLENTIRESPPSASYLAHQLVALADQGGGTDNCTVVAVRCY
ncbi:MAG: hypothetical protein KatS3mg105_1473 [Gemmatales bacterium]|nr:MAG: hypothetical protein KatS3mg105_1473 [Gemmatales bacterium]